MPWPRGVPKTMTPAERVERARKAALTRTTAEYHIAALAGRTLTNEQRRQLADVLLRDDGDSA